MSYFKLSNLLFIVTESLSVLQTSCNSKYGQYFWYVWSRNMWPKGKTTEYLFILGLFHFHYTELSYKCECISHWMTLTSLFSNRKQLLAISWWCYALFSLQSLYFSFWNIWMSECLNVICLKCLYSVLPLAISCVISMSRLKFFSSEKPSMNNATRLLSKRWTNIHTHN